MPFFQYFICHSMYPVEFWLNKCVHIFFDFLKYCCQKEQSEDVRTEE